MTPEGDESYGQAPRKKEGMIDDRILIFAPVGKDAPFSLDVLERTELQGVLCETARDLCLEFLRGASVILLAEEALEDPGIEELMECLRSQPAWSDIPILLFADADRSEIYLRTVGLLEGLRNVVILERPIRVGAALSLIKSAMRARERQYELRGLLKALADTSAEAEAANRVKDEFLATLSHELRTPLNAILGWTTMLRDGNVQPRHVMRALDTIHRNATAQVQIVNDLLDVSRIVRGQMQLAPRHLPLGPLVALAIESITPTAGAKSVTITTSFEPAPVIVWADHDRLQQVLWNLLANAVKFTSSGGRVDVSMQVVGKEVCVGVADTGTGIAAEFLPHVFERFRQGDGSSTREHGGLGLGLSIVRHVVELHGGRIKADSPGIGLGATFAVYLPVRQPEHGPEVDVPWERRQHERTLDLVGTHILIVDDEREARERLRTMLEYTGARISEAESAAEAHRIFAADRPDMLLADVAMPVQDGYAMMRALRGLPNGEGTQVRAVAVSAYARREDRQRALKAGFNDHIGKPVQADELFDALERVWLHSAASLLSDARPNTKVH